MAIIKHFLMQYTVLNLHQMPMYIILQITLNNGEQFSIMMFMIKLLSCHDK